MNTVPGQPLTRQRSSWREDSESAYPGGGTYSRRVHDGILRAIVSHDGPKVGWHLSVSHRRVTKRGEELGRYPSCPAPRARLGSLRDLPARPLVRRRYPFHRRTQSPRPVTPVLTLDVRGIPATQGSAEEWKGEAG